MNRGQFFKASFIFSQLRLSLAFMVLHSSDQLHHLTDTTDKNHSQLFPELL